MNPTVIESRPANPPSGDTSTADRANSTWKSLYRVGGGAALVSVACIVAAIAVFLAWPPPTTTENWFALFQRNAFLGLLDLDLLLVMSYVVMIPLYLALYVALRRVSQSFMAIALAFNLVGAALILGVNPGVAMLTLSDRYAAATTDAQRAVLLSAGQGLVANWSGTAFVVGYLLSGGAVLLTAAVMLRSGIFSKFIASLGLVMGVLMLVPASAGTVGLILSLVSLAPTVIWLVLVARRLFSLAASPEMAGYAPPAAALEG
jgi:hypothetical protein